MKMLGQRLAGNVLAAVAGKGATLVLGMVTFMVLARHLGAEGLGEYRVVLTVVAFVALLGDFGLYAVALREMATAPGTPARILGNALACRLTCTALPVSAAVALAWVAGAPDTLRYGLLVAGVGWIAYQGSEFLLGVFQEKLHQQYAALAETAAVGAAMAAIIGLASLGAGTVAMLGGTAFGFVLGFAVSFGLARRLIDFRLEADLRYWWTLMRTGLPVAASTALLLVHGRVDILILAAFDSSSAVGLYDVGIKILEVSTAVLVLFGGLLLPLLARDLRQDARRYADRLGGALGAATAVLVCATILVLFYAEHVAVLIAGEGFRDAALPLRILALAGLAAGLSYVVRFAALAAGLQRRLVRVDLVAVLVGLGAYAVLIPTWSAAGAALGKLLGTAVMLAGATALVADDRVYGHLIRVVPGVASAAFVLALVLALLGWAGVPWGLSAIAGTTAYAGLLAAVPGLRRSFGLIART